jgi:hypothetical protein
VHPSIPAAAPVLLALALTAPAAAHASESTATATRPAAATRAAAVQNLVVKTVRIGGKRVRFALVVDDRERAFVRMRLRRDGHWRTVASDRTDCHYYDGSHDASLEVQKRDKQVLVAWSGPGDDTTAEYGGYNVHARTLEMFGAESCTAAG